MDGWNEFKGRMEKYVHRDGVDQLLQWLEGTDFPTAPASTRYHGAHEEGLVQHSLCVHDNLIKLSRMYALDNMDAADLDEESVAIVALLHDICKTDCYKADTRNVKDDSGVWHRVPCYKFDEDYAFGGHGSKSVFLVQNFMKLHPDEAAAINCHMGAYDMTTYSNPSSVFDRNPLALLLHMADMAASHLYGM